MGLSGDTLRGKTLFEKVRNDFLGLDTTYENARGELTRRIYMDSTASSLMFRPSAEIVTSFMSHYANTHSKLHHSAFISTAAYDWAHSRILAFVGAPEEIYTCFFAGAGTTAGVNRMARVFRDLRPEKDTAVISIMEHHSNDLPHRKHMQSVIHIPVQGIDDNLMCIDLAKLEDALKAGKGKINYVSITAVSNVTGIINPIHDIARMAHKYGALIMVDGAQSVAHLPTQIFHADDPDATIDALVFSGHKTYTPGSPGVVIARKDHLLGIEPEEVGGGMVERVMEDKYLVKEEFPDREEAGTPNIPGAIALATTIEVLDRIGMDLLMEIEDEIMHFALSEFARLEQVIVYGGTDFENCPRAASISFNIRGLDHGLVAAVLNDYFNIAVRNQCFCAHPYVKEMMSDELKKDFGEIDFGNMSDEFMRKAGMVRASFGMYSTMDDAKVLIAALKDIIENGEAYGKLYEINDQNDYEHIHYKPDHDAIFNIKDALDEYLD
ncbi:MAG: aminotransferase class V-fold PLP-dependent enzyme [Candidatus Marinimicrobia bacterium]|nr:aminotransferase class V-fold PLP-dependent enzyme [Candidatus Neomarinimicrobiota bacterium]MCF7904639.1 aminotransferase class V-fold PLP-dependent enzyme [Candidatus Neomarinimicrobiota bacterium]